MLKKKTRTSTFRMESALMYKLLYIAEYDGRTMNSMLNAIVRRYVASFESQHGPIEVPESEKE